MMAEAIIENDPLSRPLHVTVWKDMWPKEKGGGKTTLRALADKIKENHAPAKDRLKWLKLAEFGDIPTPKGILRHNENVRKVSGLEADYDGGEYGVDWAIQKAEKSNVACLIYTSPSHTIDQPRWRVLAPFSDDMDPADREHLMGRLNGAFAGVFAGESWVLAQSYYYGYVDGREADHRVELVDGEAIDTLDELDVLWRGKPNHGPRFEGQHGRHTFEGLADRQPLNLQTCYEEIKSGRSYHASLLAIAAHYVGCGYDADEVRAILHDAMEMVPPDLRDRRWTMRAGAKHIEPMLEWLTDKESRKLFRRYKEAEAEAAERQAEASAKEERATGPSGRLLLPDTEFMSTFTPPSYLIDGVVQTGYLYSLTARTGHGKTAVMMFLMQCIARAVTFHGKEVDPGAVLFCAGENPSDVQARYLVLCDTFGFSPGEYPIHFINGVIDIEASLPRIRKEAESIPNLKLIIIDTAAAYFTGEEDNSNTEKGKFARVLRQLTFLPSKPAVIVPCHPVKNATEDNLAPVGGGAFLNEVDGNLTLWSPDSGKTTTLKHTKIRGPEFEPMPFRLDETTCDAVVDAKGRKMPSVVARPIGELEIEMNANAAETDENILLAIIANTSRLSLAKLAMKANWLTPGGAPAKSKTYRVAERLLSDKLIKQVRGKYVATEAGRKELGLDD